MLFKKLSYTTNVKTTFNQDQILSKLTTGMSSINWKKKLN